MDGPRVRVETSGWTYADWRGPVYPPRSRTGDVSSTTRRGSSTPSSVGASHYRWPPYFNNDMHGYAVADATALRSVLAG